MTDNCRYFTSLDELYLNVKWGWFFGIYILSENAETLLNCETILGSRAVNCFGKEKLDPGVSDRKEYQKKYYSANKEVLKQKARERYAKKKVLSSEKRILDMTIGDDSEQPVDKCRKMNENNPTVHTALFSMADSSASAPNEPDDLLPIHEQEFALKNMQKFHKSMNMKILQCSICCEA